MFFFCSVIIFIVTSCFVWQIIQWSVKQAIKEDLERAREDLLETAGECLIRAVETVSHAAAIPPQDLIMLLEIQETISRAANEYGGDI